VETIWRLRHASAVPAVEERNMTTQQFLDRLEALIEVDDWDAVRTFVETAWPPLADALPYDEYVQIATGILHYVGRVLSLRGQPLGEEEDAAVEEHRDD
jgi:hypothetical protein